ncbi:DUF6343 family protein [Streptomyces sp.]|uniref:DUF6343 family protein n=1 Tax=Streptomyces sp. TaxID=1931 RepID=UPI002F40EFB6
MHRTGYEPRQARSPLRIRLGLAICGVVWGIAAAIVFALVDATGWAAVCAAIAVLAVVDAAIVIHHIRQGPHYQPGRGVPPYPPAEPDRERDRNKR